MIYHSAFRKTEWKIRDCNLPIVRALNAEMMALAPEKEEKKGLVFLIDGNTYYISPTGNEARVLFAMDQKLDSFSREERSACKKRH